MVTFRCSRVCCQRACRTREAQRQSENAKEINEMESQTLKELYIEELKDIYSAETQLVKALPKMAEAATSGELSKGFEDHLEQTKGHVRRLEQIFDQLGEKPTGKKCKGMEGLVEEGKEMIDDEFEGETLDSGLISAAQRVEHYEIAAYGTVRAFAEILGQDQAVQLLEQTLQEEKDTDQKLTDLASEINVQAAGGSAPGSDEESVEQPQRKGKSAKA
jgi:ferritin-like metal-binding protein YciE